MDTITTAATTYTPPSTSVVHNAQVSLTDRSPAPVVHLVQYDDTLPIVAVALTANGQAYTVPAGAAVNVRMKKPDGTYVYNPALGVSENAQTAYIAVTLQMAAAWGKASPIIEIVVDGSVAATGTFTMIIDENPVPESAIESTNEFLTIQQIAEQVQQAADLVEQNAQNLQNLTDNLEAVQNAAANAQAAAASAAAAQKAAQEALGFRTFFSAITPDANGNLDPSRPMTTPSAQASWTIESKGDRIQSVQVNGFTQQAGTGDASPNNVREISTAGMKMLALVLTGTEAWALRSSGAYGPQFELPLTYAPSIGTDQSLAAQTQKCSVCIVNNADNYQGECAWAFSTGAQSRLRVRLFGATTVAGLKQELSNRYEAGTPVTFWYTPSDESQATGLYIPVETQGHEYRCQCLELTAPLCDGDKVESCVPSGCDMKTVFDGSSDENWYANANQKWFYISVAGIAGARVLSDRFAGVSPLAFGLPAGCIAAHTIENNFLVSYAGLDGIETPQQWKEYLQSNPLPVWIQSAAYTEQNDIPVQAETHANAYSIYNGAELGWTSLNITTGWVQIGIQAGAKYTSNDAVPDVVSDIFTAKSINDVYSTKSSGVSIDSNGRIRISFASSDFPSVNSLETALEYLSDNAASFVYPLTSPAVYARDPVTLVAVPYTDADVAAANQMASMPSTLPNIDSPDVPMLLDAAEPEQATPAVLAVNAIPVAGTYVISSQDGTTVLVSLKAFQDGGDAATLGGQTLEQINADNASIYLTKEQLLTLIYPVGSIYMSANNVSPQTFLGGTWEQIQGQFLLAASESYPAGKTGGSAEVSLSAENIPNLTGYLQKGFTVNWGKADMSVYFQQGPSAVAASTSPVGDPTSDNQVGAYQAGETVAIDNDGDPIDIMPPYLSVYMWQRTA